MKKPTSIKDIEDNFRKKLRNGHFGLKDKILGGFIEEFYRQQITELLEQIEMTHQYFPERESDDYDEGYNDAITKFKQILNNIKK